MHRTYGVSVPLSSETIFKNIFCHVIVAVLLFIFVGEVTGEFRNDPYANDDHGWWYNGYTVNRLDDQLFLEKDILVAPIVNPG